MEIQFINPCRRVCYAYVRRGSKSVYNKIPYLSSFLNRRSQSALFARQVEDLSSAQERSDRSSEETQRQGKTFRGPLNREMESKRFVTRDKVQDPVKSLTFFHHRSKGRNNAGIITCRHRGGGHKRLYRNIDFRRDKIGVPAKVMSIEYDPNRNARIALLHYLDGEKRYILHPRGLNIGEKLISDLNAPILVGNSLPLRNIPLGAEIHNVEFQPGSGGQLARAAGSVVQILAKEGNFVTVRLPSKEIRLISKNCWATLGQVGNVEAYNFKIGKAGRTRWLGIRPTVRGSAMNPVDHPHGGGEGRAPIGHSRPLTPWGKPALGKLTRKPKKYSNVFLIRKRK